MRELSIHEYSIIAGGITETQCVGAAIIVGGVVGGVVTRNPAGLGVRGTIGGVIGGVFCAPITSSSSEDGDG